MRAERRTCENCEGSRTFCDMYDAYFCSVCDRWLEATCTDPECEFCAPRPDVPSLCHHGSDRHY